MTTWDKEATARHAALAAPMRVVRCVDRTYYLDAHKIDGPQPLTVAPRDWTTSSKPSSKAITRPRATAIAYWPRTTDAAVAYLRSRHCCGVLFEDQPIGFDGAFPFGWIWINLDALPVGERSWAGSFALRGGARMAGHRAVLGPNVIHDGAKLHSSCDVGVPHGTPDSIILWRVEMDAIATTLGAYRAWRGGDDAYGKGLDGTHNSATCG